MQLNPQNIRKAMKALLLYASSISLDAGLLAGHREFSRFVILSGPRTGTNFLRTALNFHSRIVVFGELFRFPDSIGWDLWAFKRRPYGNSKKVIQLMQSDPERFLDTRIFRPSPRFVAAVGFKIFYFHAREGSQCKVWDYLSDDRSIKVIHLKRLNLLRTYLSHQRALQTNIWINQSEKSIAALPMHLDPGACEVFFEQMTQWQQESDELFAFHPKIDVFYENLVEHFPYEVDRVQNFLQVDKRHLKPSTHKQTQKPLSMDILNYEDLVKYFYGTKWKHFFQE